MALASNEAWRGGFVVDTNTGNLMVTTVTTAAQWQSGFLRDTDGRLVIVSG